MPVLTGVYGELTGLRCAVHRPYGCGVSNFSDWIAATTADASHRTIARELGLPNTAVSRWVREGRAPADRIVAIARAYNVSPLPGLEAAGILDEGEAGPRERTIRDFSDRDMLEELLRRVVVADMVREHEDAPRAAVSERGGRQG